MAYWFKAEYTCVIHFSFMITRTSYYLSMPHEENCIINLYFESALQSFTKL